MKRKTKIDIEAKLFMFIFNLKEDKNKEFSFEECETNIVYLFENEDEFKSYFMSNGVVDIAKDVLKSCKMKTTKKGTIISLKKICDYTIKRYKLGKELTESQVNEIHSRGKITPTEKVKEWEGLDLCAPGDAIGGAANRCREFPNCHECLVDYAYMHKEYDPIKFKLVNRK